MQENIEIIFRNINDQIKVLTLNGKIFNGHP